jgi:small subunit ribosomal protein S5
MRHKRRVKEKAFDVDLWQPKTEIGRAVKEKHITSLSQIFELGRRPLEPEIIDALFPDLEEEIITVSLVQRMHKSGRRVKYHTAAAIGNKNGVIGVGHASAKEVGPSIQKATVNARLSAIEVARGCGSWECGCGRPHSIPFKVKGKAGSVEVTLIPAPLGLGLTCAKIPKIILSLAGIKDVWCMSKGKTKTSVNFALAVFDALKQATRVALREGDVKKITIGPIEEEVEEK